MAGKKCKYTKDNGKQCGAYAMKGSEFCYLHNPAIRKEQKKLAQTRGGANRRALTVAEPLPPMTLETPKDVVLLLVDTINRVRAGELDVKVANCLGVLTGHLIKALEVEKINDKLEAFEQLLFKKRGH